VFVSDPEVPGRYKLIAEEPTRPAGEKLDYIIMEAMGLNKGAGAEGGEGGGEGGKGPSLFQQIGATVTSLQRFMRSLSN
jgi:hypothetical protein